MIINSTIRGTVCIFMKDNVMNDVIALEKCFSSFNVPFDQNDRAHRIGLSHTDNYSGNKSKTHYVQI